MNLPALRAMLERHEAVRPFPYVDSVGKITIGCGRNLTDDGLSTDEIGLLLTNDMSAAVVDLSTFAWWPSLSDARQQALADMRFNLGPEGFREFRHLIHALAVQNYPSAAQEMTQSRWAAQVGTRAVELAQMMKDG